MRKVQITVLKREFYPELADEYLCEGREVGPCPIYEVGDSYIYEGGAEKPEGLCPWAWLTLYNKVNTLCSAGFENDWYKGGRTRIDCCTDGVRPVIFRVEALEE